MRSLSRNRRFLIQRVGYYSGMADANAMGHNGFIYLANMLSGPFAGTECVYTV